VIYVSAPGVPEEAKWLSDEEKALVTARLAEDVGDPKLDAPPTWREVLGGFMYFGLIVSGYGYAFLTPLSSDPSVTTRLELSSTLSLLGPPRLRWVCSPPPPPIITRGGTSSSS